MDFALHCISDKDCEQALSLSLISRLNGLRTLHATISQPSQSRVNYAVLRSLDRMQVLPFQDVTVVVNDSRYPWEDGSTTAPPPPNLWPITERRQLAERIRSKLLDPNGPENQAAEMKEEEGLRKRGVLLGFS